MKRILLQRLTVKPVRGTLAAVLLVALQAVCFSAAAQEIRVSGIVTDMQTGDPVVGAAIYVEGTSRGTTSGPEGRFSLQAPGDGLLVVTFLGYETSRLNIAKRTTINIELQQSSVTLEEVVAIGYGTVAKSDLTSSIASITEKDIMKTPVTSIDQALQGNAAGVLVINTSAEPGGEVSIRIRGGSSISGNNEPLIVIDGFPSDNATLSMLNPNDVKSMEVLKDASATAIYGSRGANGVVMITTHSGEAGKAKVSVNAKIGLQYPRYKMEMMDGPQHVKYDNFARMVWGVNSVKSTEPDTVGTMKYQDMLLKSMAMRQDYSVNVSGGANKFNYYVSGGLLDEEGILNNSGNKRLTIQSKINAEIWKGVTLSVNANMSRQERQTISSGGSGATLRTLMLNPSSSKDGTFVDGMFIDEETGEVLDSNTEIARSMNSNNWTKTFQTTINGSLKWKITDDLTLSVGGGYKYTDKLSYSYTPRFIYMTEAQIDKNNKATRGSDTGIGWNSSNTLTYGKTFNKKHYVNAMLGFDAEDNKNESFGFSARRFDSDYAGWDNLPAGAYFESAKSGKSENTLVSFFSRVIYNYDKRFLTTFTFRSDGSSRFGEDRKYGYFPSASAAWVISREKWMKEARWLNNLKVRFSWGITGNHKIGQYQSMSLLSTSKILVNGQSYTSNVINQIGNENLKWETTHQYNGGIDVSVLNNKLTFAIDGYYKKTFDLLYSYRLPLTTGYSTVMANIGNIDNKGIEFEMTSRNLTGTFNWTTSFNIGYNQSKVTDLGGNDNVLMYYLGDNVNQNITFLQVGKPLGVFMGYKTSIFKNWDEVYADDAVWVEDPLTLPTIPGMLKYHDINGDGVIDDDDKVILGQAQPKLMGGLTNTFEFKGFFLSVFFNGAWGNKIVNTNSTKLKRFKAGSDNQHKDMFNTFRPINPVSGDGGYTNGKYPIPTSNSYSVSTGRDYTANLTNYWIEDGSYLRLKSITLGYDFPQKMISKLRMTGLNFSVTGTNLFTWTKYSGFDPEMSSSLGSSNSRLGVDQSSYPAVKTVTFNLKMTF